MNKNITMTFLEKDYNLLQKHLFKDGNEQAAYLLCSLSQTEIETRFLVKEVIQVEDKHILKNNNMGIYYTCDSYMPVIAKAKSNQLCFIMVHCHPCGISEFSDIDNEQEIKLLRYAYNRINNKLHGSMIFSDSNTFTGRILNYESERYTSISKIRVLGDTYKFINSVNSDPLKTINKDIFNRNILAFGEDLLKILQNIHIGVVGCGGTGSAVIEELCRLGVGKLTLIDDDKIENTNITRIHGSNLSDVGKPKVTLMQEMIGKINIGTNVIAINEKLDNPNTAKKLRDCDLIFSCVDYTHFTRSILNQIAIAYYIPLIDAGIKFDSKKGILNDIFGRIDVVLPNDRCLFCSGIIDSNMISAELMTNEEYIKLKEQGYVPELPKDKVQVIPYNSLIGSYAVIEMIQLLTNFKGKNIKHIIYKFMANKTLTIEPDFDSECICNSEKLIGCGDIEPFLLLSWAGVK
ncbi:HesA/MoeB/ThiF family protein [Clostridium arbusti]|uniref:HesA/MoeB/ThiF family protein n=1 Tax=Clostridium arbusti TaxID=1137848 RepID=UPI0002DFAC6B|nr:ThiF family adenylyltransferase [Clostridium arbusti]